MDPNKLQNFFDTWSQHQKTFLLMGISSFSGNQHLGQDMKRDETNIKKYFRTKIPEEVYKDSNMHVWHSVNAGSLEPIFSDTGHNIISSLSYEDYLSYLHYVVAKWLIEYRNDTNTFKAPLLRESESASAFVEGILSTEAELGLPTSTIVINTLYDTTNFSHTKVKFDPNNRFLISPQYKLPDITYIAPLGPNANDGSGGIPPNYQERIKNLQAEVDMLRKFESEADNYQKTINNLNIKVGNAKKTIGRLIASFQDDMSRNSAMANTYQIIIDKLNGVQKILNS